MRRRIVLLITAMAIFAPLQARAALPQQPGGTIHESPHKKLKRSCEACHTPSSFTEIRFDHDETGFPLEGGHNDVACLSCHSIEDFSKVEKSCATCHNDVHRGKLGVMCERCHLPQGWAVFDAEEIHAETNFPVMGRHSKLDCEACHKGIGTAEFHQARSQCVDCHEQDYQATTSPSHVTGNFSRLCTDCHTVLSWTPATMTDHDPFFPIFSGTHRGVWDACTICHTNPSNNKIFSCVNCHEHDQSLMDPAHAGVAGYSFTSTACYECHPTGVAGQFVDHDALYFPIFSGTHNNQWDECQICHTNPSNRKVFDCLSCHEHDRSLMDPAHQGITGYSYASNACYECHPTGQAGNFVEHDSQFFPIFSGTHNNQWDACETCHTNPSNRQVFDCTVCHEHDRSLMDPVHTGMSGYSYTSTACYECHPTGVAGNFVDHDLQFFPIYSGTHRSQWDACEICHTTPTNRQIFSCLNCHEHDRSLMDPAHQGITGYAYVSTSCYDCHPTGEGGNFVDHDAQFFPIYSGTHNNTWDQCQTCHVDPSNQRVFDCRVCHEHDQSLMDPFHQGMSGYSYVSTACYDCHPDGNSGQFTQHDSQFFPIYSGRHRGTWNDCTICHNVPGNRAAFSCIDCHEHNQSSMDSAHRGRNGYQYNSNACYDCHPNGRS